MKENDIIERLHKAYDVKEPDVLSKLNFSQVEMVPPPEKNLKARYVSAVAVYAAACLVVALLLPFLIGRGGNDDPKPQPGVSPVGTETIESRADTEKNPEYTEYDTVTATQSDHVTSEAETENNTLIIPPEPPISIDVYPIPVEPSETEPAIITTESPTPPEETTTTTGKRFDPVGTSATTKKPNPAPKVYADPADCVRIRFFKDMRMTQEYTSADDIPAGARVYYKIETDPGYICTNFSINVYGVGMDEIKDGLVGTNYYPFFDNNHLGDKLEYSLTAVLAGDADGNLMYDQSDVDTLNKYLAGDTTTIWLYGRNGYSEKLDYNCDGVINVNDRMQLQSEISTGAANRQVMPYYKYSHDVGTITYRLPTNINSVLPHGRSLNSVLTDGGTYDVYKSSASISNLSDEIREEYDDNFFMHYDLVLVYCYTEDDTVPIIHEELNGILCTESRNGAVLNPVIPEVKAGETLSDYAICIAASKRLNVLDDAPM